MDDGGTQRSEPRRREPVDIPPSRGVCMVLRDLGNLTKLQWPVTRGLCPLRPVPSVLCPRTLGTHVMLVRESRALLDHNSQRSEARGQRASDHSPATSASSGERPEHQSPEPSTLATPIGYGMVRSNGTRRTQQSIPELVLRRAHHGLHAAPQPPWEVGVMRARAITSYKDGGLAEDPRPPSQHTNSRAERKPVSPYVCRGTALMLSRDNHIGQSVAEHPSRLEFP
jgi:hypothetical protein